MISININKITSNPKIYNFCLISLISYFVLINYSYFAVGIISFLLIFGLETKISNSSKFLYQGLVLSFYFKKFFIGYFQNNLEVWESTFYSFYDAYLPDLHNLLQQFNCNYEALNFDSDCLVVPGYGPLVYLIKLQIDPDYFLKIYLVFLFALIIFLSIYAYKIFDEYSHLVTLALISPVVNFIIHQMNIDFIILLVAIIFLRKPENNILITSLVLLVLSLIKIHPIALIVSLIIIGYIKKNRNLILVNLGSLIAFTIYMILYFIRLNSFITSPRPSGLVNAVGLLTTSQYLWINFIKITNQYRDVLIIYFLIIILLLFFTFKIKNRKLIDIEISDFEFIFIIWILVNYLYANYDYRSVILLPIFFTILRRGLTSEAGILLLFFIASPINPAINSYLINLLIIIKISIFFIIFFYISKKLYILFTEKLNEFS